jgi:hypothetical protein
MRSEWHEIAEASDHQSVRQDGTADGRHGTGLQFEMIGTTLQTEGATR